MHYLVRLIKQRDHSSDVDAETTLNRICLGRFSRAFSEITTAEASALIDETLKELKSASRNALPSRLNWIRENDSGEDE